MFSVARYVFDPPQTERASWRLDAIATALLVVYASAAAIIILVGLAFGAGRRGARDQA
jgi:hypothetical protein